MEIDIHQAANTIGKTVYFMQDNKVNSGVVTGIETFRQQADLNKKPNDNITFRFDCYRNQWERDMVHSSLCFLAKKDLLDSL